MNPGTSPDSLVEGRILPKNKLFYFNSTTLTFNKLSYSSLMTFGSIIFYSSVDFHSWGKEGKLRLGLGFYGNFADAIIWIALIVWLLLRVNVFDTKLSGREGCSCVCEVQENANKPSNFC